MQELAETEFSIFSNMNKKWSAGQLSELALLKDCGLNDIHVYPFSHLICYSDTNFPVEYRKTIALDETAEEISWLKSRYNENKQAYAESGFAEEHFSALIELWEKKLDYLTHHFETDDSYEWHGGFNFIVTGKKP